MGVTGHAVGTGVLSLEPGSQDIESLSELNSFSTITGTAPGSDSSFTEQFLDLILLAFVPGDTVANTLGIPNDTIVPAPSQSPPNAQVLDAVSVPGIVHTSICSGYGAVSTVCGDVGETQSNAVFSQVYYWLTGGTGSAPADVHNLTPKKKNASPATAPLPILNLSGYAQVPSSNISFSPVTGSTLTINTPVTITATSSTKVISEVLLLQAVTDSTDTPVSYSTQSPFAILFTPARLGSTTLSAIAVFNDNTYAAITLNYTLTTGGIPSSINLLNAPSVNMIVGNSRVIKTEAMFSGSPIDVTQSASYTAASGSGKVFSISAGGTISATGNGVDLLNVSYEGATTTTQIAVGSCTYSLNPTNQIVSNAGGSVTINVATQSGCAWTALGGASWLPITAATGSGNGVITLSAAANTVGGTQGASVSVAGLQAYITQPATPCVYALSQEQITAPAGGAAGTIGVTSSCPIIVSSNATWITAAPFGSFTNYIVAVNDGTSQRSATLTIGTQPVSVVQAGNSEQPLILISGQITAGSVGLAGVTITLTGSQVQTATTDSKGYYAFTVLANGNYTATPTLSGYTIVPPSQTFNGVSTDQTASFTATCTINVNPLSIYLDSTSQSAPPLTVVASPGCSWTAVSSASFVTITSGISGNGNGLVTFTVPANNTGADLSGTLNVGGQTIAITQRQTAATFADVTPSSYYFDAVNLMSARQITAGCGTNNASQKLYCPSASVTRDEMAIFIVRTIVGAQAFSYSTTPHFDDVPSTYFAFPWIQKLYELGITAGCSVTPFNYCPASVVTRDEMAIFIIRARYGAALAFTWNPVPYFEDVPANYFAFDWVQRLYQDNVTAGCSNTPLKYCPSSQVVRGDMAIFVMRGGFNQLLPSTEPVLISISPATLAHGETGTFTITGANTAFAQGFTNLVFSPDCGITVNSITVNSPTSMQVSLKAAPTAPPNPISIYEQTEPQEAVLPNGLLIQ